MHFIEQQYKQIHIGTSFTNIYLNYRNLKIKLENHPKHLYSKTKAKQKSIQRFISSIHSSLLAVLV